MADKVLFSSATDDWATPQDLFDRLDETFGFTLDVCASEDNHKCAKYFTKEQDGLKQDWGGGDYMVQSALWPRDWQVGSKVRRASRNLRHVIASSDGHEMVAGVYSG